MLVLYGLPISSYTAKVRIALIFKGLPFQERPPPGGYQSEAWRLQVPTGTIPALQVQGVTLAESEVILEYLEDAHPNPSLLPGNALDKAHARFLARLHDLHLEPRVRALFPLLRTPQGPSAQVHTAVHALQQQLGVLAKVAQPSPYLAGNRLSVADLGMLVSLLLAQQIVRHLGVECAFPQQLQPWLDRVCDHAAVAQGLVPWQAASTAWLQTLPPSTVR